MRPYYFYDLPVYRLDREKYYNQLQKSIEQTLYENPLQQEFYEKYPKEKMIMENLLRENYGGGWEYNEIIGYIRLHILGTQIRGEYWQHKAKKMVKSRKRQFQYVTHKLSPEKELSLSKTNKDIYNKILEYIESCRKELKNRFIDTSNFETLGSHVDWQELIHKSR